jgi:hypothetical protein
VPFDVDPAELVGDDVAVSEGVADGDGESDELAAGVLSLDEEPADVLAEPFASKESLVDATALLIGPESPPETLSEVVMTTDDVGGDPQSELCAAAAGECTTNALNVSRATPKRARPIAAPSATGLRSSALTRASSL